MPTDDIARASVPYQRGEYPDIRKFKEELMIRFDFVEVVLCAKVYRSYKFINTIQNLSKHSASLIDRNENMNRHLKHFNVLCHRFLHKMHLP